MEELQGGRGVGGRSGAGVRGRCGPEAPCGRSLAAMEHAHRQALDELQRQHERQMKELQSEKDRLLLEEIQDTARGQTTQISPNNKMIRLGVLKLRGAFDEEPVSKVVKGHCYMRVKE